MSILHYTPEIRKLKPKYLAPKYRALGNFAFYCAMPNNVSTARKKLHRRAFLAPIYTVYSIIYLITFQVFSWITSKMACGYITGLKMQFSSIRPPWSPLGPRGRPDRATPSPSSKCCPVTVFKSLIMLNPISMRGCVISTALSIPTQSESVLSKAGVQTIQDK